MSDKRQYVNCRNCKAFDWSGNSTAWGWCQLLPPSVASDDPQPPDEGCWSGIPKGWSDIPKEQADDAANQPLSHAEWQVS